MVIKLKGLRLYIHPKDQYLGKKKTWKCFHIQLTTEIYMADEAEKKQTEYFPRNRSFSSRDQACFVIHVTIVRLTTFKYKNICKKEYKSAIFPNSLKQSQRAETIRSVMN